MEKNNIELVKVLKEIFGKKWKKYQVNEIKSDTFGVKIKDGDIIGLGLCKNQLSTLPEAINILERRGVQIIK